MHENHELMRLYIENLSGPGHKVSDKQVRYHCSIVVAFARFMAKRDVDLVDATSKQVSDYLLNRSSVGMSYMGLGHHLTCLSGFYSFLVEKKLIKRTPARRECMPNFLNNCDGRKVISIKYPDLYKGSRLRLSFNLEEIIEEAEEQGKGNSRLQLVPPPDDAA